MKRGSTLLIGFLTASASIVMLAPGCGSSDVSGFDNMVDEAGIPGPNPGGDFGDSGPRGGKPCTGLCQQQVRCDDGGDTTVSGIVYDPAGKVPLYNVVVYVPNAELGGIQTGASCDRCDPSLYSGNPLTGVQTDAKGQFKIPNMPVGKDIPLVIQIGKWRRTIKVPHVARCVDTPLPATETRLPRNQREGNIPLMAITTGGSDSMECLPLRMGIDISEYSIKGGPGRIHLYKGENDIEEDPSDNAYSTGKFVSSVAGGASFPASTELWNSTDRLKAYDMVILSCEGSPNPKSKPPEATKALYEYESIGGRVFASHWHEYFFRKGPEDVQKTGTWDEEAYEPTSDTYTAMGIVRTKNGDKDFPKGIAFADWLDNVKATNPRTQLSITEPRGVLTAVNASKAQEWITIPTYPRAPAVQFMSYNAPIGAADDKICGRAIFTDMHVSAGVPRGTPRDIVGEQGTQFPAGCKGYDPKDPEAVRKADLTPQEKALEFMLFDLASCVSSDDKPPPPPVIH
ncbi:hypothetical protein [Pendulispora albinea]|uniref:Carboxypeptidase-like regulatory domain-containing protein n=1 Tax=Pendulispora albinea TaxID=2741071 RepID=A0ABZ2M899_9BACT